MRRYESSLGASVRIAGRSRLLSADADVKQLSKVLDSVDQFVCVDDLSSLRSLTVRRGRARRALEEAVERSEAVIGRLPSEIGLAAVSLARKSGKPVAIEMVACPWDGLRSHGSTVARLYAPVAYWRTRRAVAASHFVRYVTDEFLQRRYPTRGRSIVASDVDLPPADGAVLDARLGSLAVRTSLTFGMIASLFHKQKGIQVALMALAEARTRRPDLRLRILGPGDAQRWRDQASLLGVAEAVTFCGTLPRGEAVLDWLDGIDVYVQASFQEGLPRALVEAMSRATPALASDAGGTRELIEREYSSINPAIIADWRSRCCWCSTCSGSPAWRGPTPSGQEISQSSGHRFGTTSSCRSSERRSRASRYVRPERGR